MVQAAARGVVDFSEADLLDRRWWQKLWWLLDQVEDENVVSVRRMQHDLHCGLLEYGLEEKAFETHWEQALKGISETWDTLVPWQAADSAMTDSRTRLRQAWINKYGDPNDPDTMRRIQLSVDYLKGMGSRSEARKRARVYRMISKDPRKGTKPKA